MAVKLALNHVFAVIYLMILRT